MIQSTRRSFLGRGLGAVGLIGLARPSRRALGDDAPPGDAAELPAKAVEYLRGKQADDGSWSAERNEPGITGLVVAGLLRSGRVAPEEPAIARALAYLEGFIGPGGGLSNAPHSVYTTSVALMAFHEANKNGRYDSVIRGGQAFLKASQYDETEGKTRDDPSYGGLGYGDGRSRPDLSNTSFFIEALRDSGLPPDDPALQRALIFVSRCQNLKSEFNDQPWAGKVDDGGFVYAPPTDGGVSRPGAEGKAQAGGQGRGGPPQAPDGGLRSVAGMTYAGLKSMIHAGLTRDDPRVQAAIGFIKKHYDLDENSGQGQRGLYYYYHTFARAMALLGQPTFTTTDDGAAHDWRADLTAALARRQAANGSWVNSNDRFMEGDPNIVTAFALLALAAARPKR